MEFITEYGRVPARYHEGEGQGLLLVFPGLNYPPDYPLLYYTRKAGLYLGFGVLELAYDLHALPRQNRGRLLEELAHTALAWAGERAPRVVLSGKSAGTLALAVAPLAELDRPWARVWLTPLLGQTAVRNALARERRGLAVAGSEDPYAPKEIWDALSGPGLRKLWIEGADHRLESPDPARSAQHLAAYAEELLVFLQSAFA